MESWRKVFRDGIAPGLSDKGLLELRQALLGDDPGLIQGATTSPPPLQAVQDWPVEAACPAGYCGWKGDGLTSVREVEEFFAKVCYEADQLLGEPASCRFFLNWVDETPRPMMRWQLLPEVEHILLKRGVSF